MVEVDSGVGGLLDALKSSITKRAFTAWWRNERGNSKHPHIRGTLSSLDDIYEKRYVGSDIHLCFPSQSFREKLGRIKPPVVVLSS